MEKRGIRPDNSGGQDLKLGCQVIAVIVVVVVVVLVLVVVVVIVVVVVVSAIYFT